MKAKAALIKAKHSMFLAFILVSMTCVFFGCGDTDPPCDCEEFQDISDEMKGYVDFSKGDYWVYQLEQDTAIRDTLTCTNKRILDNKCASSQIISGNANPCSKIYELVLSHSNKQLFPSRSSTNDAGSEKIYVEQQPNSTIYSIKRSVKDLSSSGEQFHLPGIDPGIYRKEGSYNYTASNIDCVNINNITYKSIVFSNLLIKDDFLCDSLYLKENVGILRYTSTPTQTWELFKYVKQ